MKRISFLGTEIDNLTRREALIEAQRLIEQKRPAYVVTPNVDHIVKLEKDNEFRRVYQNADLILTDGKPLIWISKWLKTPIKEKISGSDFFPDLCEIAARKGYRIFLLGAAEGVAKKAAIHLEQQYPGIKVTGVYSPPFGFEKDIVETQHIIELVKDARPDILAVGVGAPKQEKFIYHHYQEMGVPLSLAIGASIDFLAGNVERAPRWMSKHGLEWFYRLMKEPRRMYKRYLIDDIAILRIMAKYKSWAH